MFIKLITKRILKDIARIHAKEKLFRNRTFHLDSVLLDIKPWDDETDMNEMLKAAKSIEKEGLVWGASKLVPVGYGII